MAAKKKKKLAPKKKAVAKKKPAVAKKKKPVVAKKKLAPKKKVAAPKKKKAAAPKKTAAPKKKAAAPKKAKKAPVSRRDRPGHINPTYGKQLREKSGPNTKSDSVRPAFRVEEDDVAEELGGEVVKGATTGENNGEEAEQEEYVEEVGGPFVVTNAGEEFAEGTDASNPADADQEPFPKT